MCAYRLFLQLVDQHASTHSVPPASRFPAEKGHPLLLLNNNSTLTGMMSCLNSPPLQQMHLSPLPPAKRPGPATKQPQQQQGTAAVTGKASSDLQSLFHTFRGSGDAATRVVPAAESGNKAQAPAAGAPTAPDVGSGPADQQQLQNVAACDDGQVGDLYQYLLGTGGDSWLMPPAGSGAAASAGWVGVAGGAGTGGLAGPAAAATTHGCSGGTACPTEVQEAVALQNVNVAGSGRAAVAAAQHTNSVRSAGLAGSRGPGPATQQQQPEACPQHLGVPASGFNPEKPFAALFPGAAG